MVEKHLDDWPGRQWRSNLLFIENVGNLVCPTSYDLGEDAKIVVLSVTEGEDKPLKYPGIFRKAELMILNKIDLLPYVPFKPELARENARRIHPEIEIIETSCTTGAGLGPLARLARQPARSEKCRVAAREESSASTAPGGWYASPETDVSTALAQPGHHAPAAGEILQRHAGHAGAAGTLSGADGRGSRQSQEAGAGLAAVPGLHRLLGIDAAVEPSGRRRRRARSAFLGISRGDHGRRRQSRERSCWTAS